MKMRSVFALIVIAVLMSGCFKQGGSGQPAKKVPLVMGETVFYRESSQGPPSIVYQKEKVDKTISPWSDNPSKPRISPDKNNLAYIAPMDFEVIGDVYMFHANSETREKVIQHNDIPDNFQPKRIGWINDNFLYVIMGYAYGTISVGGDLYIYDVIEKKLKPVTLGYTNRSQITDVILENDEIILLLAVYDDDFSGYKEARKEMKLEDLFDSLHDEKPLLQENVLDSATVGVGDKIAGFTVSEVTNKLPGITDEHAFGISFSGSTTFSGTFTYYKRNEYFTNKIVIKPDEKSLSMIPVHKEVLKYGKQPMIVINQPTEEIKQMLGEPEVSGSAVFTISNYVIRYAAAEVWNTANLLELTDLNRNIAAKLPDGTPLYENQDPVDWEGARVQVVNLGFHTKSYDRRVDVSQQLTFGNHIDDLVITELGELQGISRKYPLVKANQAAETKYVLLDYVPSPLNEEYHVIYSIVVTSDDPADKVKQLLQKILKSGWSHFN